MPSFGLAHPRARFRFDRLTPAALARIARFPSYRAPRAADLHDPDTFPPATGPVGGEVLTGRAFITAGAGPADVRLVAVQPFMGELASCPHLATLRRLDLTGNRVGLAGARALAGSPHLGGLRELGLSGNDLGADGAAALASAPWLAGLTRLELGDNRLSAEDVARVCRLTPRVSGLDVSGNRLGSGATLLGLPGLRHLSAAGCGPGSGGVTLFCAAGRGSALESLDLRHNRLGPAGGAALMRHGPFPALGRLDLGFNDCTDAGAALLAATELPAVRSLGLRANRLTPAGAAALANSRALARVEVLDLSVNSLGDDGVVAACAGFPALTALDLANTGLTDAGVCRLIAAGAVGRLRTSLSLAWNPLGDAAGVALAGCPGLAALGSLDLTGTRIGTRGVTALVGSPYRRGAVTLGGRFGTIPA